jgi:short-subunit dehydrogenase
VDLKKSGVAVTAICPGYVRTELTAKHPRSRPFIMELDEAVAKMMRGIDRKVAVCAFPRPLSTGARTLGLLPPTLYDQVARRSRRHRAESR